MSVLANVEPKNVFYYFEELCKIPHGSFNTKAISDYCVNFAKEHNITWYQDEANNVIIIKEATPGYENAPAVMIQGHLDMVCQKAPGSDFDFEKDGLKLAIDGDMLLAEGTTLGGDDGIAVAYGLAILAADNLSHPRVEAVFTSDEEVGLLGAQALDLSCVTAKRLINIDSEEEGIFLTSCAGGGRANLFLPVSREEREGIAYELSLEGLTGGHSGIEINKGRGNSNKMMARLLMTLAKDMKLGIEVLEGGQADNAIARQSVATVLVEENDCEAFEAGVKAMEEIFKNEQRVADPELVLKVKKCGMKDAEVLDRSSMTQVLTVINLLPNGIQAMSMDIEGLVETSLNLGVMKLDRDELRLSSSVRSSIGSKKEYLFDQLRTIIEYAGGSMKIHGEYPAWEYVPQSELRDIFAAAYEDMFGAEPQIEAIHAGLECGILSSKIPGLDCISCGPNMYNVHTTEERLSISSTERTWKLLVEVLRRMK